MRKLNVLFISGNWNEEEGRSSRYMSLIIDFLKKKVTGHVDAYNGGNVNDLRTIVEEKAKLNEVIFWFPNIPNYLKDRVTPPKDFNPSCTLINYKRNDNGKLSYDDLKSLNISTKADLTCEVYKDDTGRYQMRILDSLDTVVSNFTPLTGKSVTDLVSRIYVLRSLSYSKLNSTGDPMKIINTNFEEIVDAYKAFGEILKDKVSNKFIKRHLGEIAFRGYIDSTTKSTDIVFVNQRHVKLDDVSTDDPSKFIGTRLLANKVNYYGEAKPCFNCGNYLRLLTHLPHVNYILYSNMYIEGARFTEKVIPSHCIQQANELLYVIKGYQYDKDFAINLLGCGSMIFLETLDELPKYFEKLTKRNLPEFIVPEYSVIESEDTGDTTINLLNDRSLVDGELLDIMFDDNSNSVYKVVVTETTDEEGHLHKEAKIRMTVKGISTEVSAVGLRARRV